MSPHKQSPQRQPPYKALLALADDLLEAPSQAHAEIWASELLGTLWLGAFDSGGKDSFRSAAKGLVIDLGRERVPAALAILRALSRVGEDWFRNAAAFSADSVAARGVPEPAWHSPGEATEFVEARAVSSDLFGDVQAVGVTYRCGSTQHTIVFLIESAYGIKDIRLYETPEGGIEELLQAAGSPLGELSATQVWYLIWPALIAFVTEKPDARSQAAQYVPLAQAWISLLEVDVDEDLPDVDQVVDAFLASPHGLALPDRKMARRFAEIAAESAADEGRHPAQFGPYSLSATLVSDFAKLPIAAADLPLFPDIVRAWAYFTSDYRGLPQDKTRPEWDRLLPKVLASFDRVRGRSVTEG